MFISIPLHYSHTRFSPSSVAAYRLLPTDLLGRWIPEAFEILGTEVSGGVYVKRNILS